MEFLIRISFYFNNAIDYFLLILTVRAAALLTENCIHVILFQALQSCALQDCQPVSSFFQVVSLVAKYKKVMLKPAECPNPVLTR